MRFFWSLAIPVILICACSTRHEYADTDSHGGDTLTLYSSLLTMVDRPDGAIAVTIADPWNEGSVLQRLLLVARDSVAPQDFVGQIVRVPIQRAAVFSSVHTGGLKNLDALDAVVGVADAGFFPENDTITSLLHNGLIADFGSSQAPTTERIAAAQAEVVLRSPIQGLSSGPLPPGVVPIEMADYMETSPLGRAEWILLLGALTGKLSNAQDILTQVVEDYSDLHLKATLALSDKPKILTETEQSGVWYVPGARSYMARFITDAGGRLPWEENNSTGSVPMGLEAVAAAAIDADIWLIRSYGSAPGADDLVKMNPRYAAFKPVQQRSVWSCNSAEVPIFDDIAFHPERLLADYIAIFHPEVLPDHRMNYFQKSK